MGLRSGGGVCFFGGFPSQSECSGGGSEGFLDPLRFWHSALGQVLRATAASAELGGGFFQERDHIVRLAGGLSEDQRGLRRGGGEQRDRGGRLAGQLLGQQLEEVEVAAGESTNDQLAAVALGSFR